MAHRDRAWMRYSDALATEAHAAYRQADQISGLSVFADLPRSRALMGESRRYRRAGDALIDMALAVIDEHASDWAAES